MSHGICGRCEASDRVIVLERCRCSQFSVETCRSKSPENMPTVTYWCMPSHCKVRFQYQLMCRKNLCMFINYSIMYILGINWGCGHDSSWAFPRWKGGLAFDAALAPLESRCRWSALLACFLSPMDRRWGSKSSKTLEADAVLSFFGRVTMPPGGARPSGGSAVVRLFFFKGSTWFSSRIAKCFTLTGARGTGFGGANDCLAKSSARGCTFPFLLEKVDLKGASFVDEPELEFRQSVDAPSLCDGACRRIIKSDRAYLEWTGCESTPGGRGLSVDRVSLECKLVIKIVWIYMLFNECKRMIRL